MCAIQPKHKTKFWIFEMKVLQKIAVETRFYHIRNDEIRDQFSQAPITCKLERKQNESDI